MEANRTNDLHSGFFMFGNKPPAKKDAGNDLDMADKPKMKRGGRKEMIRESGYTALPGGWGGGTINSLILQCI